MRQGGLFLLREYPITYSGKRVGTARLCQTGLYAQIDCYCEIPPLDRYRMTVNSSSGNCDLGICVPMGTGIGVKMQLPLKQLGTEPLSFALTGKRNVRFVPVCAGEPFSAMAQLRQGYFGREDGQPGIFWKEKD